MVIITSLLILIFSCLPLSSETCKASWYEYGSRTANGEKFNKRGFTAASRLLPFGSYKHIYFGKKHIIVRINDRGPFVKDRCIDLTRGAFSSLAPISRGTITVNIK